MTHTAFPVRTRTTLAVILGASSLFCSGAAFADKGGIPNQHASPQAQGSAAADDHAQGSGGGASQALFSGIVPSAAGSTASLLLTNAGTVAGTATVTLYAADTGTQLGVWTSASIPPKASLLVDAATIAATASPALTAAQAGQAVTLSVQSHLNGSAQYLSVANGVASNLTPCGPAHDLTIGAVPGPGSLTSAGAVRIINGGSAAAHVVLTLYNSTDGTTLGAWTSPDVPANGSVTVSTTAIAAAANPVVAATTASFTLSGAESPLTVQILSMPKAGGPVTSLNDACVLHGAAASSRSAPDDADDSADDAPHA